MLVVLEAAESRRCLATFLVLVVCSATLQLIGGHSAFLWPDHQIPCRRVLYNRKPCHCDLKCFCVVLSRVSQPSQTSSVHTLRGCFYPLFVGRSRSVHIHLAVACGRRDLHWEWHLDKLAEFQQCIEGCLGQSAAWSSWVFLWSQCHLSHF